MFSIVNSGKNKIVRKNIASRKDLVWPDGFVSPGYSDVGEIHQLTKTGDNGEVAIVTRWKLYEDTIENGEAGRRLRLGPPFYDAASDQVIRDMISCDDPEKIGTGKCDLFKNLYGNVPLEEALADIIYVLISELSVRGNPASQKFKDLTANLHRLRSEQKKLNISNKEKNCDA